MMISMKNPEFLGSSKMGTRGQVTIPKMAREKFDLKTGDMVLFIQDGEKLTITKKV